MVTFQNMLSQKNCVLKCKEFIQNSEPVWFRAILDHITQNSYLSYQKTWDSHKFCCLA